MNATDDARIKRLYLEGLGVPSITKKLGINRNAVRASIVRQGIGRDRSTANSLKMQRMGPEGRGKNLAKARAKRLENLRAASHDPTSKNPAVGTGYHLIAEIAEEIGATVQRQILVDGFYVDLFLNNIAVEIEYNVKCCFGRKSRRFKHFAKSKIPMLYVVHDGVRGIFRHRAKLITYLKRAYVDPPTGSQYRVIRCSLELGTCCTDGEKLTAIRCSNYAQSLSWSH